MMEVIKENMKQPNTPLQSMYGHKKAAARRTVGKAQRDEDSQDVKPGSVIKGKNGKLVTDRKDVLHV